MFVYHFKLNKKLMFKTLFIFLFLIVLTVTGFAIHRVLFSHSTSDSLTVPQVTTLTSENYTNILKSVHENLDSYVGQKITFTGYVYRVYDFSETQFVLARNMVISSDNQTLVVGFLCDFKNASQFQDNTWVNITGKITKGDYHGTIPVIEITQMKEIQKPDNEFVYPPDDTYIPTSALF